MSLCEKQNKQGCVIATDCISPGEGMCQTYIPGEWNASSGRCVPIDGNKCITSVNNSRPDYNCIVTSIGDNPDNLCEDFDTTPIDKNYCDSGPPGCLAKPITPTVASCDCIPCGSTIPTKTPGFTTCSKPTSKCSATVGAGITGCYLQNDVGTVCTSACDCDSELCKT